MYIHHQHSNRYSNTIEGAHAASRHGCCTAACQAPWWMDSKAHQYVFHNGKMTIAHYKNLQGSHEVLARHVLKYSVRQTPVAAESLLSTSKLRLLPEQQGGRDPPPVHHTLTRSCTTKPGSASDGTQLQGEAPAVRFHTCSTLPQQSQAAQRMLYKGATLPLQPHICSESSGKLIQQQATSNASHMESTHARVESKKGH
jgi:hypothetical protein